MRTFSLIWSGIGCFATVAITVLGGVILAGGNNSRAADYTIPLNFVGIIKEIIVPSEKALVGTYDRDDAIIFRFGSVPFTVTVVLEDGYVFDDRYPDWSHAFSWQWNYIKASPVFAADHRSVDVTITEVYNNINPYFWVRIADDNFNVFSDLCNIYVMGSHIINWRISGPEADTETYGIKFLNSLNREIDDIQQKSVHHYLAKRIWISLIDVSTGYYIESVTFANALRVELVSVAKRLINNKEYVYYFYDVNSTRLPGGMYYYTNTSISDEEYGRTWSANKSGTAFPFSGVYYEKGLILICPVIFTLICIMICHPPM
jgi:hypothetical protein